MYVVGRTRSTYYCATNLRAVFYIYRPQAYWNDTCKISL